MARKTEGERGMWRCGSASTDSGSQVSSPSRSCSSLAPSYHFGLLEPWWEWPRPSAPETRVRALIPRKQPEQVPLREKIVDIVGAAPLGFEDLMHVSIRLPSGAVVEEDGVVYFAIDVRAGGDGPAWRVRRRYSEFRALAERLARAGGGVEDATPRASASAVRRMAGQRCSDRFCSDPFSFGVAPPPTPSMGDKVLGLLAQPFVAADLSCAGAEFPRRYLRQCSDDKLSMRRYQLELWLRAVLMLARRVSGGKANASQDMVGRRLQVKASGRVGRIVQHLPDDEDLQYKVEFNDACGYQSDWFDEASVDVLPEGWRSWMADLPCFLGKGRTPLRKAPTKDRATSKACFSHDLLHVVVTVPADSGPGRELAVMLPDLRELTVTVPVGCGPGTAIDMWYDRRRATLGCAD